MTAKRLPPTSLSDIPPHERWACFVHEAGHAEVGRYLGFKVLTVRATYTDVFVQPRSYRPFVKVRGKDEFRQRMPWEAPHVQKQLTFLAAGEVAQQFIAARRGGGSGDYRISVDLLRQFGADRHTIDREIIGAQRRAARLVKKLVAQILATAHRLAGEYSSGAAMAAVEQITRGLKRKGPVMSRPFGSRDVFLVSRCDSASH